MRSGAASPGSGQGSREYSSGRFWCRAKVPVEILRFRCRRFWHRRFRSRYLGGVPEGSGTDTEVRFRKVPVQSLIGEVSEGPGRDVTKNKETQKNCQTVGERA